MSANEARLTKLEILAETTASEDVQASLGRGIRASCANLGVTCWPASEDARWAQWSREHGGEELWAFLDTIRDEAEARMSASRGDD